MKLNFFNFKRINDKYLLTNDFGAYIFLDDVEFKSVIARRVIPGSELWNRLLYKRFIYEGSDVAFTSDNRYDVRELHGQVNTSTSLHIFVVATSCNLRCVYCQANNGHNRPHLVMDRDTAERAVRIALQSPAEHLSFEFQGGEPLLNFDIIRHIVNTAETNKGNHKIAYNLVSNLTLLTDEMLDFFVEHGFGISTSIDGPQIVHDKNRPFPDGSSSFTKVIEAVGRVRDRGISIGAIETTTKTTLSYPRELVRAYHELGFDSIFIRPLTPLGKATVNWDDIGYSTDEFLSFYKTALDEILQLNRAGTFFRESHAEILLRRMCGQMVNYMELRSPCGAGIGQLAFFPDGNVFTCDEGRMIYEMGNDSFLLGNVNTSVYSEIVSCSTCRAVCASSILQTIPNCCDCVYQPYCGTCPVVNYAQSGDLLEKAPRGYRCKIYSGILDTLFLKLLENEKETVEILLSWSN